MRKDIIISDALCSFHFWKPIVLILLAIGIILGIYFYIPMHYILWTFVGIITVFLLFAVGMIFYMRHINNLEENMTKLTGRPTWNQ